ncbi:hypothetical protein [Collimonas fungivorans]|uniref:hypothetical protein n=1 Tax=Collimonas fungivorans TaxID=158899 RepID=UPI003FA3DBA4
MEILIHIGLGIIAGIPLPIALLSRRYLDKARPASKIVRFCRNFLHLVLMLLGVVIPWSAFWLSHKLESTPSAVNAIVFVVSIAITFISLVVKLRLHDSRTWKRM